MTRLDLNLLVVLDALLSEGSVTRAAQRLHLAQPTVSNALARLRRHLNDPLLERAGREMRPTTRAKQLMLPVREALAGVERALSQNRSVAGEAAALTIRISATDYVTAVLLPPLLTYLRSSQAEVRVIFSGVSENDPLKPLERDETDLVIGSLGKTSPYIHRQDLFSDTWSCVARVGNPMMRGRFTAKKFREAEHLQVRPQHGSTGGTIDEVLAQSGAVRNVAVALPHLFAAPYVLMCSDLILTLATRIAHKLCADLPLKCTAHPLRLKPFVVSQLWHQRTHAHPGHAWLRKALAEVAAAL